MSETSRAMLGASTDGTTVPKTMPCTSFPSISARWMSSETMSFPSSIALMDLSTVPAFAKGVRTPATIATRRPFPYRGMVKAGPGLPTGEVGADDVAAAGMRDRISFLPHERAGHHSPAIRRRAIANEARPHVPASTATREAHRGLCGRLPDMGLDLSRDPLRDRDDAAAADGRRAVPHRGRDPVRVGGD